MIAAGARRPETAAWDKGAPIAMAALLAAGVGIALGLFSYLGDHRAHRGFNMLANLGAPWLVAGAGVGYLARRLVAASVAGAVALTVATVTYYASIRMDGHGFSSRIAVAWFMLAMMGGAVVGLIGANLRDGEAARRWLAISMLAAAFVAESAYRIRHDLNFDSAEQRSVVVVVFAELIAGLALPFLLRERRQIALTLALLAVAGLIGLSAQSETAFRSVLGI